MPNSMSDKNEQVGIEDLFRDEEDKEGDEKMKKEIRIERLKDIGIKVLWITGAAAVIAFLVFFNNPGEKNESKDTSNELEAKELALKDGLVKRYDAVIFDEQGFSFSKDVQERKEDNFLLKGDVYDIFRENDKVFVKIDGYDYFGVFEVSAEQEEYIRKQKSEYGSIYDLLIVVRLSDISKSLFDIEAERDNEDIWTYREPSEDFLLKGQLLDVKGIASN